MAPDIRSFFSKPKTKEEKERIRKGEKENSTPRQEVSADEFFSGKRKSEDPAPAPSPKKKQVVKKEVVDVDPEPLKAPAVEEPESKKPASPKKAPTPKKEPTPAKKEATPKKTSPKPASPPKSSPKPVKRAIEPQSKASPSKKAKTFDVNTATPLCLSNKSFVFTGVLGDLGREEAQEIIKTLGGRVTTAVSGKTDYLVAGEILEDGRQYTEGSKYRKANEHGTIVILGLESFYGFLQEKSEEAKTNLPAPKEPSPKKAPAANPYKKPVAANPYAKAVPKNPYAKASVATSSSNPYAKAGTSKSATPAKTVPVEKGGNQLWVDKYKPSSTEEILGNQELVRKLTNWLNRWEDTFNQPGSYDKAFSAPQGPWKAALLSGPPGIGKTTTATLVSNLAGRDVIEFNASDVRSKKALHEGLGDITGSNSISFAKVDKAHPKQKRCIIMDEVDGMGAGDRSGISELIQMIKHSRVPIICICNDRQAQKIKSLVAYCMDLRFRRPTKTVIAKRAMVIARNEGLSVEENAAEAIAESCGNDIRQVLNCLQMWASNGDSSSLTYKGLKDREKSINKDEILRVSLFDAARTIMEGRRGLANANPEAERSSFFSRNDAYFVDYSFTGLLVQQNYLKVMQGQYNEVKRGGDQEGMQEFLERMHSAAESMSDYTHVESSLRGGQNWSLLPFCGSLTVKTGFHAGGPTGGSLPGFPEFTTWLGRNSTQGKKKRLMSELHHHFNYRISGGTQQMRLSYLPVFRERLLSLITNPNESSVEDAIKMMDEYGLDRDDVFEKLDEFKMDAKAQTFAKLDSKKKAAFTRAYNAGSHKSQALVAEQGGPKKTKRSASSGVSDTFDPDAIDDDKANEPDDEEENDEEDLEELKTMFKAKGRKGGKKAAAATKTKGKGKK